MLVALPIVLMSERGVFHYTLGRCMTQWTSVFQITHVRGERAIQSPRYSNGFCCNSEIPFIGFRFYSATNL